MAKAPGTFQVMQLDLCHLPSVPSFADACLTKYVRLDALVNNAGLISPKQAEAKVAFELQSGVNHHLGHFLLTELLLEVLKKNAPHSRIW